MCEPTSDSEGFDEHERNLPPNPALALTQHPRINTLRSTLSESLPFCSGTLELPSSSFVVYYNKAENESRTRVDLLNASTEELDALEKACDPATFGVDQKDVFDISYRKAGKLDKSRFSVDLDVDHSGLLHAIKTGLLSGKDESRPIYAELYKLNVYGVDSFFKAHKDTPRGGTMFGSLVLVFPTPHKGGALLIQHDEYKYTFDASALLAALAHVPPSRIAYIAFFSDVEHEVQRVAAGHRITLAYNLHFAADGPARAPRGLHIVHPRGGSAPAVHATLHALLGDASFLPAGGTLGFGLRHLYALPTSIDPYEDDTLETLRARLKGADAALLRACTELGLSPVLYTIFEDFSGDTETGGTACRPLVACPRVVKFHTHDYGEEQPLWEKLCRLFDGVLVNPAARAGAGTAEGGIGKRFVHWVTPVSEANRVKTRFAAYGNEPMMGYLYQRICLLVDVGPAGRRDEVERG